MQSCRLDELLSGSNGLGNVIPTYRLSVRRSNQVSATTPSVACLAFFGPALRFSIWSVYRIRLRVIERHRAEITALNEQERTRIAGELHDGVMQRILSRGAGPPCESRFRFDEPCD